MFKHVDTANEFMIMYLLTQKAKAWWYHAELRKKGEHAEAEKREQASIAHNLDNLRNATWVHIGEFGQTIYQERKFRENGHSDSKVELHGGWDNELIVCAYLAGVPIIDTTTVTMENRYKGLKLPLVAKHADDLDDPPYGPLDFAPLHVVALMWLELGATIYNLDDLVGAEQDAFPDWYQDLLDAEDADPYPPGWGEPKGHGVND